MPEHSATRDGAVLFDLDGTFADTAPDMAAALDRLLAAHGRAALPLAQVRPFCSYGARGILKSRCGSSISTSTPPPWW